MALTKIKYIFSQKDMSREDIRRKVVEKFLEEKSGPAKDENYNRYEYHVENSKEGNIILVRPANLKLGFDFRVDVKGMKFIKGSAAPSHIDIFEDLKTKFKKDQKYSEEIKDAIIRVAKMEDPSDILKDVKEKNIGYSVELLLKINKWLFVEQDIRYWNGWGRNKFVVWLQLMNFFKYEYETKDNKFYFFDKTNTKLTEKKAIEVMNSS